MSRPPRPIATTAWLVHSGALLKQVSPADFLRTMAGAKFVGVTGDHILVHSRGHDLIDVRKDEWTGDDIEYRQR